MMSQEIVLYRTKDTTAARNNVIKYGVYKDILPHLMHPCHVFWHTTGKDSWREYSIQA